ncbi:MAG: NADH-quinone oxidoreductase subunit NuoE [Thermoanaerobacterales bacterium]|jgi:NADH-quinone oxidoreductase subunit E|nr:NADH-quinone oxidoreductase subunit NuoE [Thermoanaerobacterales bacterium]
MSCSCKDKCNSSRVVQNIDLSLLDPLFEEYSGQSGSLISILQRAQDIYGYLPLEVLQLIADKTGNKRSKIYGIATFYAQFRLKPVGKYIILQCQGTACHVNGSEEVKNALCDELSIKSGETTEDGLFTLEEVACLGCCSLAPVMMINGETYGKLTPESARRIIKDIVRNEKAE